MELSNQIVQTKSAVERASTSLLKTFGFVPDEKLGWSPSDTSRSALWIMGHCGAANRAFAQGIRGEAFPPMSLEEFGPMVWNQGRETATREEAVRSVEASAAEVLAALDGLTPEGFASTIATPFGPMPVALWMTFADGHMFGHANQIEYLQTIWGDQQNHMM